MVLRDPDTETNECGAIVPGVVTSCSPSLLFYEAIYYVLVLYVMYRYTLFTLRSIPVSHQDSYIELNTRTKSLTDSLQLVLIELICFALKIYSFEKALNVVACIIVIG